MKPNTAIQLATIMLRMTVRQQPHSSQSKLDVYDSRPVSLRAGRRFESRYSN